MRTVLVAYATKNGSTRQVAQAIAATLRTGGADVSCRPAASIGESVAVFDLVVLGAPLYNGRWHRDAHRFLKRHSRELSTLALFGMGPRGDEAQAWGRSRAQLDRALAKHPWLVPMSVARWTATPATLRPTTTTGSTRTSTS